MQQEYKVQKGESIQDVVIKLYGSLDYQYKFIADNNLWNVDVTQQQLYENDKKVILNIIYNSKNISIVLNDEFLNIPNYNFKYFGYVYLNDIELISEIILNPSDQNWYLNFESIAYSFFGSENNIFPFSKNWIKEEGGTDLQIINVEPYFEPFTVVYDDSIIKSIVPAITTTQTEAPETQKAYTTENNQSFFDISIITTGGLNNIIALANQNNVDINTFNSQQTKSISYYIEQIENRINYNFMQTLLTKPATETYLGINSSTHVAFNESFNISFG
jgi:hypothetical protein